MTKKYNSKTVKNHRQIYEYIDENNNKGCFVRVRLNAIETEFCKNFAYGVYGGSKKALSEAVKWRNKVWARYDVPETERRSLPHVGRSWCYSDDKKKKYYRWRVRWRINNVVRSKTFSEIKFGVAEAQRLANDYAVDVFDLYY